MDQEIKAFLSNLADCQVPYFFVDYCKRKLIEKGYKELKESQSWNEIPDKFFCIRGCRQILAMNKKDIENGGKILAGATDFPCLKQKPFTKIADENYDLVKVYIYGDPVLDTWVNVDLCIKGLLMYNDKNKQPRTKNFSTDNPVAFIPSVSKGTKNLDTDYNPIINISGRNPNNSSNHTQSLLKIVSEVSGVSIDDIIDFDITFVVDHKPCVIGKTLFASNLSGAGMALAAFTKFLESEPEKGFNCFVSYDSSHTRRMFTKYSAKSNFLTSVLERMGVEPNVLFDTRVFIVTKEDDPCKLLDVIGETFVKSKVIGADIKGFKESIETIRTSDLETVLDDIENEMKS